MANDLDLKVKISADLAEIRSGLGTLGKALDDLDKKSKKAGADSGIDKLNKQVGSIKGALFGLAGAFGAAFSIKSVIDAADEMKQLEGRLRLATKSQQEFNTAQAGLSIIAKETRQGLKETVDLYSRMALATKDANVPQGELLAVTQAIGKAVKISGADTDSANAAMVQLSQGLASGTLRGDELNSVLEQTPRVAQAIADGMGIGVGELRKMGEAGKITGDEVIKAIRSQARVLDEEFQKIPPTVADSMTQVGSSFKQLIADFDKASGASAGLSGAIASVGDFIAGADFTSFIDDTAAMGAGFVQVGEDIVNALQTLVDAFPEHLGPDGSFATVFDFFTFTVSRLPIFVREAIQKAVVEFAAFSERILAKALAVKEKTAAIFNDDTLAAADARLNERLNVIEEARKGSVAAIEEEADANIRAGEETSRRLKEEKALRQQNAKAAKAAIEAGKNSTRTGEAKKIGGTADGLKIGEADTQEAIKNLERIYQAGEIGLDQYAAKKRALSAELAALDIQQAERKVSEATDEKTKSAALTELELAKRKAAAGTADLEAQLRTEQKKRNEDIVADNAKLQEDLANAEGRKTDARLLALEEKHRATLAKMKETGNREGAALAEQLYQKDKVAIQFDAVREQYDKLLADLAKKEQSYANRVRVGNLTQPQADKLLEQDRASARAAVGGLIGQAQGVAGKWASEQQKAAVEEMKAGQDELQASASGLSLAYQNLANDTANMEKGFVSTSASLLSSGISQAFADMVSGAKSAGEAFADMAKGFATAMAKMLAEYLAKKAIMGALNAYSPGAGDAFGASVGVSHTGGIAGSGGTVRRVSPSLFAGAPRYHAGGVAGLKPGEVPAILQKGEEVLTQNDPRHAANGGGQSGGGGGTRVINVIDPNMVADYMASSEGEKVFLNVIQRNAGAIRQAQT